MRRCEDELLRRFELERVRSTTSCSRPPQEAEEPEVDWRIVEQADGADRSGPDWNNLMHLVARVVPKVIADLCGRREQLLLVHPGLIARYDQMAVLETLRDRVGHDVPCPGLWVLVATDGQHDLPMLDNADIPLITPGQRARVSEAGGQCPSRPSDFNAAHAVAGKQEANEHGQYQDLLPALRGLVKDQPRPAPRSTADEEFDTGLREAHRIMKDGGRTAQGFEEWRDDYIDQVAVAWVLACVFVRFMEDNDLINERWIAGEGEHGKMAEGEHELYFKKNPHATDREYLQHVFVEVRKIPAAAELFAEEKTPLWALAPSGDAAKRLLDFFRAIDPEAGGLKHSFLTKEWNTQPLVDVYEKLSPQARFLGDLYQDLSEHARKKYALLQTPVFVEEFILDRTLTLALDEFGLDGLRMIDPTCGSGHFLLGAFDRLFHEWRKRLDNNVLAAQHALDGVWGVDINPFAVAITRFRLLVAAVNACGVKKLNQQSYSWTLHLATGDSLLWGSKPGFNGERVPILRQGEFFEEVDPIYAVEDPAALREVLGQGYHIVVGNPPYITVKDKAQSEKYRELYSTCHRQYSLGVPFTQRFWELAIRKGERISQASEAVSSGPGYVGMITASSFMKREFGKKLIEEFFPKIDLTHVLDTSGAHIPGHGTPTVILYGRSHKPVGGTVRAVLGIKGEPSTPEDPAQGLVWQSIVRQIDRSGAEDEFTSTADATNDVRLSSWSIGGGGAAELKATIEEGAACNLSGLIDLIGYICMTRAETMYVAPRASLKRAGFSTTTLSIL
ncbi:MAG: BREX-2 system adenine-specific DNA-methyltransferase PglX [Singulisphaera sp.]